MGRDRNDDGDGAEGDDVKRVLVIIVVFLLAGAVVNVAVAWGCGAGIDVFGDGFSRRGVQYYKEYSGHWSVAWYSRAGAAVVISDFGRFSSSDTVGGVYGPPPHELVPHWGSIATPVPPGETLALGQWLSRFNDARGWPMLSLYSEGRMNPRTYPSDDTQRQRRG